MHGVTEAELATVMRLSAQPTDTEASALIRFQFQDSIEKIVLTRDEPAVPQIQRWLSKTICKEGSDSLGRYLGVKMIEIVPLTDEAIEILYDYLEKTSDKFQPMPPLPGVGLRFTCLFEPKSPVAPAGTATEKGGAR